MLRTRSRLWGAALAAALVPAAAAAQPVAADRLGALPPGSEVTVHLSSGERLKCRLAEVTPDGLRMRTSLGQVVRFDKSDILRIERHGVNDPVGNGIAIGALAGAGAGLAIVSAMYATCGDGCDAPARGPTYATAIGFSAGIGAAVGWIVDRAHKGKEVVFPTVAPIITRDRKVLTLTVRF